MNVTSSVDEMESTIAFLASGSGFPQPPCKWVGGKRQLLPELLRLMPEKFNAYHEPFVGGGALFFALFRAGKIRSESSIADVNEELIHFYRTIAWPGRAEALIRVMTKTKAYAYDSKIYYAIREQDPKSLGDIERAARFLYLNKTCFNGLFRVNKAGKFNVPFGSYTNPTICDVDNLLACAKAFHLTEIDHADFAANLHTRTRKGDFVYCDPPYVPVSATSDFTSYTKEKFGLKEQERLATHFRTLHERGVFAMLTNSDTPLVRELYAGFDITPVSAVRSVNSKADKRGAVTELVVRSWIKA